MYFGIRLNKLKLSVLSAVLAAAAAICIAVPCLSVKTDEAAPVLYTVMYHGFTKNTSKQNSYMIDPSCLEDDLRYLSQNGYTAVTVSDLAAYFDLGTKLPDKPVMLTFDDGYYSNWLYAFPLLRKYGFKAVLSPIGKACEETDGEAKQNEFYSQCSMAQLSEMFSSGIFEPAYHTYSLHEIKDGVQGVQMRPSESDKEYEQRLREDISMFRRLLKDKTGAETICFTYPFGAVSENTLDIVKSEGFRAAMDCEERPTVLSSADELYHIHRYLRPNSISAEEFFKDKLPAE